LRTAFKKVLDKLFHPLGLNMERYFGKELALKSLAEFAKQNDIDLLLDVGANTGQFSIKMIEAGFDKQVISFEPLSSAYPVLLKNTRNHSNWKAFDRCAIGDVDGEIEINISLNSHSSSILQINKEHTDAAPSAAFFDKEKVAIRKLDSISAEFDPFQNILLKIDTQGFEKNVLAGAENLIAQKVKIIQLEISLLPLYEGVMPFEEMIKYLDRLHFKPLFYSPGYVDRTTEQIQQLEGYFIKKNDN
jgi:FkbM family methyltransferase